MVININKIYKVDLVININDDDRFKALIENNTDILYPDSFSELDNLYLYYNYKLSEIIKLFNVLIDLKIDFDFELFEMY